MKGISEYLQNLREVYNMAPEGVIISDLQGKIIFLNHSMLSHSGIEAKSYLKKKSDLLIQGKQFSVFLDLLKKKKAIVSNNKILHSSGCWKTYRMLAILLTSNKEAVGIIYIIRLDKSIVKDNPYSNKSNPIIRVLNQKKNEIIHISDFQNYLTLFCSDTIESICGWTAEEFTLGGWAFSFILMHPLDRINVLTQLNQEMALRNENKYVYDQQPIKVRFRFKSKSGDWVWFNDKLTVLERDANGDIIYMIGIIKIFKPSLDEDYDASIKKLEENIIIRDGKTYVNLETLLEIQKKSMQLNRENSTEIVQSFNLTNRELEILSHIVDGLSSEEIGDKIHIAKNTVNMHRKQIMKKLEAKNLAQLVRKSLENGLFLKKT